MKRWRIVLGIFPIIFLILLLPSPVASQLDKNPLIAPGATLERIARGFGFLEGPTVDVDGTLYFSDVTNERIHRWTPTSGTSIFIEKSGQANGLYFDLDGQLLICEMGNRRVTARDEQNSVVVLADELDGQQFNSPNDLWVSPRGGIYFTDPWYGPKENNVLIGEDVYYISPDRTEIKRVADDLIRPNGIIGTPDGWQLYIADHGAGRTYVYTTNTDGSLTNKRLFAAQGSDGMTIDEKGNLYLTGQNVTIYNPEGKLLGSIAVPEAPANLTFGGSESRTLFITARTSLYSLEMNVSGK